MSKQAYDVAAFVWPSYTGNELRSRIFWPEGIGEWQTVRSAVCKKEGHSWPRKPLWGYVNEADPKVMEMQIREAVSHGVNTFIYDWYWYDDRPFLENCLDDGFLKASNVSEMKFYIMWANHTANHLWSKTLSSTEAGEVPIWDGAVDRTRFEHVAHRLIEKYFQHPQYYRIDGKPVLMIYDVNNLIRGLGGIRETREALDWMRGECVKAGLPGLHLQVVIVGGKDYDYGATGITEGGAIAGVDNQPLGRDEMIRALGFDSATNYQFVHIANVNRDYAEVFADVQETWQEYASQLPVPYFPHVTIGWDNNPRFTTWRDPVMTGNTPEAFKKAMEKAREYVDQHELPCPLITVNSWNEWTETSYLEPDDLNGYGYLEAVREVILGENDDQRKDS